MKIFLDANVIFSAAIKGSNTSKFLPLIAKKHKLVTSSFALDEATKNLSKKIKPHRLDSVISLLKIVEDSTFLYDIDINEKDRPIISAAIANNCDYLLTGDIKDFAKFFGKKIGGVKILRLSQASTELL